MPPIQYKDMATVDLGNPGARVIYQKSREEAPAALCSGQIADHPVLQTFTDNFNRAGGFGFQSANWRNAQGNATAPGFMQVQSINGNRLRQQPYFLAGTPAPPDNTVGGIYTAAPAGDNWHVKATIRDFSVTLPLASVGNYLVAPISQANPADPNPNTNTLRMYGWSCAWVDGFTFNTARFGFRTFMMNPSITPGQNQFIGISTLFISPVGSIQPGSTYELYVLCNNAPNPPNPPNPVTLIGLVDGVVRKTSTFRASVPAGFPGIGTFGDSYGAPFVAGSNFIEVDDWQADLLA